MTIADFCPKCNTTKPCKCSKIDDGYCDRSEHDDYDDLKAIVEAIIEWEDSQTEAWHKMADLLNVYRKKSRRKK